MACEGVEARKGFKVNSIPEVAVIMCFPLHQSCPKSINVRKWLSVSETNESHHRVLVGPDIVCRRIRSDSMMHTWRLVFWCGMFWTFWLCLRRFLAVYRPEWLNIIGVIHYWSLFMRQREQPQVLIQRGSYLQRCRSHSVVPVIAIPRCAGRYLHPLWLRPSSRLFHCLTIQIV